MQKIRIIISLLFFLVIVINQVYGVGVSITNLQIGNSWPRSLAIDPRQHILYVVTVSGIYPPSGFALIIIDAIGNRIIKVIPFNGFPGKLLFNQLNDELYLVNGTSICIFKNGILTKDINLNEYINSIAINPKINEIYAASLSTLFIIDGYSSRVIQSIKIGNYIQGIVIDENGKLGYLIKTSPSELISINLQERSINSRLPLNTTIYPESLVFNSEKGEVFVSTGRNTLLIIDPKDNLAKPLLLGDIQLHTRQLAIDQIRGEIFVSTDEPSILIIDARSLTIINTIRLQYEPYELAIEEKSGTLYFTNYHQLTEIRYIQEGMNNLYVLILPIVVMIGILLVIFLRKRTEFHLLS